MNDSPLARYLIPVRRWWWVVAGIVLLAVGLAWLTLPEPLTEEEIADEATSFRATHLLIRNTDAQSQLSFDLIELLAQQGDLTNRVVTVLGDAVTPQEVEAVTVEPDLNTDTLSVTAIANTPSEAAELSTTFANQLVAFIDERTATTLENDLQRVTNQADQAETEIDGLQDEIAELPPEDVDRRLLEAELDQLVAQYADLRGQERALLDQRAGQVASFVTFQEPSPVPAGDEDPAVLALPTSLALRLALAAALALVLGLVVVLTIDYLDTRVRTRRDAEEAFGLPVLAELPIRSRRQQERDPLPTHSDPGGVTAEVLRSLRLSVSLAPTWRLTSLSRSDGSGAVGTKTPEHLDHEPRSILVTSPLQGDGKSTLVANLAVSLAEGGKRVLVVDCDFRRPAIGFLLDATPGIGLRELSHATERALLDLASPTMVENVAMVRAGNRGVTPSWFMSQAHLLVQQALDVADVVLFDTGPIMLTNEAAALLPHVDTSLIVTRSGKVATDQARDTVEQFTQVNARVSGVVLIGSEGRRRYGYGYYQADDTKGRRGRDTAAATSEEPPTVDDEGSSEGSAEGGDELDTEAPASDRSR